MQARKVKAGSPLGLLFDHGIDIWVIPFFNIMNLTSALSAGDSFWNACFIMQAFCAIYFLNVEHLYVGVLDLPLFDGNADGIHIIMGLYILRAIYGSSYFTGESLGGYKLNELILMGTSTWGFLLLLRK